MSGISYSHLVLTKFGYYFPSSVRIDSFVPVLRSRLRDIYVSNWRAGLNMSSALDMFREIKLNFDQSVIILKIYRKYKIMKYFSQFSIVIP